MVQGDTAWSILDPVCNLWEICSNILSRRKRQNIYFSTASHPNSRFEDRSSAPTILLNDFQNRFKSSMHFNCGSNPSVIMRVDHSVTQTVDLHLHQARIVLSKNIDWLLHSFTLPTVDLETKQWLEVNREPPPDTTAVFSVWRTLPGLWTARKPRTISDRKGRIFITI